MKLLVKILALIFALAGAALGIALLKQEHAPSYISVYDTDDDLFWFFQYLCYFSAFSSFLEGFPFFMNKMEEAVFIAVLISVNVLISPLAAAHFL